MARNGTIAGHRADSASLLVAQDPSDLLTGVAGTLPRMAGLPPSELEWWLAQARRQKLQPGKSFCEIGQRRYDFGILRSGIMQIYDLTPDGDRIVLDFIFPGMAVMALDAAVRQVPSEVEIEAVTDAELWVWPYELRLDCFERHAGWRKLETICLEQGFVRKHARFQSLRLESSRERFRRLNREFPPEWVTIPQGLVASYLNITPQYLSRLRRELRTTANA